MPVEVWIDANGVVRRQTATLDATTLSGRVRGTGTMTLTVDLTDLGQPVEITVPPADQVSDFDPMSALGTMLDGLGTTPGGS